MMKKIIFLLTIMSILFSCNSTSTEEKEKEVSTSVEEVKEQSTADFWAIFQKAVVDSDVETIESLYLENAINVLRFSHEEYKAKIAKSSADEIRLTNEKYQDKVVYEYQMLFPGESADAEGSATSVYMIRNEKKQLRIFNVLEAG